MRWLTYCVLLAFVLSEETQKAFDEMWEAAKGHRQ